MTEDGRVLVEDRTLRPIVRQIANPLRLGTMSETHFVLSHEWRNHFNRQLAAANKVTPTVGELRAWINQPQPRGLLADVEQLLILVFAEQTNRSFCRYDRAYTPTLESMPDELELRPQPLPTLEDWERAVERNTTIFGGQWTGPLTAANAVHLAGELQAEVQRVRRGMWPVASTVAGWGAPSWVARQNSAAHEALPHRRGCNHLAPRFGRTRASGGAHLCGSRPARHLSCSYAPEHAVSD